MPGDCYFLFLVLFFFYFLVVYMFVIEKRLLFYRREEFGLDVEKHVVFLGSGQILKIFLQARTIHTYFLSKHHWLCLHIFARFCFCSLNSCDQKYNRDFVFLILLIYCYCNSFSTCFLAFSFEKQIANVLISYFIYSQHSCSSFICPRKFFNSVTKSGL